MTDEPTPDEKTKRENEEQIPNQNRTIEKKTAVSFSLLRKETEEYCFVRGYN